MICSKCNKEILPGEYLVKCSKCGKTFHSVCWVKNKGCSTPNCKGHPSRQFKASSHNELKKINNSVQPHSRYNPKGIKINKCPVCHKLVLNGDPMEECHSCHSVYHKKCWDESGGCILRCHTNNSISPVSGLVCPYCMMQINSEDDYITCPKCGIPHHRDCWDENGGCTTYGCDCKSGDEIQTSDPTQSSLAQNTQGKMICPYCQSEILPGDDVIYCEQCNIPHHTACWNENKGCTTYGCTGHRGYKNLPPQHNDNYTGSGYNYPPAPQNAPSYLENCMKGCIILVGIFMFLSLLFGGCFAI